MQQLLHTRLKATGIHLCLSLAAFLILLYVIVVHWYPPPLFTSNGGWQGVQLMLLVLFVLGPLLTLVIYNPAKARHLIAFDLIVIAVLQTAAVTYGAWTIYQTRPVVLSIWDGRVYPVLTEELARQGIKPREALPLSDQRPPVVYVRRPQTREEAIRLVDYGLRDRLSEPSLFFLYAPLTDHIGDLFARSIEQRRQPRSDWLEARQRYLERFELPPKLAFLPFEGRYGTELLVFDAQGRLVGATKP